MFFFFKQKTAYEVRISDWSSDVCSSDLLPMASVLPLGRIERRTRHRDGRLRLGQGIAKTHTIDGEEQLAFADHLIVPDMHLLNPAGHIGRQRHYVGAYLSVPRSEEHTSELQSLMRISYAVFCLKKKITCYSKQLNT